MAILSKEKLQLLTWKPPGHQKKMLPEEKVKGKSAAGTPRLHVGKQKDKQVKSASGTKAKLHFV